MYTPHNEKTMDATHETVVAKLGSRISLNFRPQNREIYLSPLGRFFDKQVQFNFGVMIDGIQYGLGFGYRQKDFQYIDQHEYFDRVVYRCKDFDLGLDCTFEFIAPFYPRDKELVNLPALYVVAKINRFIDRAIKKDDEKVVSAFCDVRMSDFQLKDNIFYMKNHYDLVDDHIHYQDTNYLKQFLEDNNFYEKGLDGELAIGTTSKKIHFEGKTMCVDGKISQHDSFEVKFVIAGYSNDDVLKEQNKTYKLLYTQQFKNAKEVLEYSITNCDYILSKTTQFNELIKKSSVGEDYLSLLGLSMRSFAMNTWWAINDNGEEWFSVVEGNCLFHSTVDVEFNDGLFYYLLWPELLEHNIKKWVQYKDKNFIKHDIGAILNLGVQGYTHPMEIEENSNFLLMLFAYVKMYNKVDFAKEYKDLIVELIKFNKSCDLSGNGLPNKGTANTIDDSSEDVQFAEESIYLGIKEYAGYKAASYLLKLFGDTKNAAICDEESSKIVKTIEEHAWLDDHYAVNLISSKGKINQYSLYQQEGGNVSEKGKDAYTIYTANGLLYLMMCGETIDFNINRLKLDIVNAHNACHTHFGDTHSNIDTSNVWISQNMWRDLCAGYMNIDMFNNVENYWQYLVYENQGGRGGCFIDTYGWNKLNYYPRGLTCIGYFMSMIGLSIDGINKEIKLNPSRIPAKVPLFQFADWKNGRVPVVEFCLRNCEVSYSIDNPDLIKDYKVSIE